MSNTKAPAIKATPQQTEQSVATKPKFVFQDYQDNTGPVDKSRVDELLEDGFPGHEEIQLAWIHFNGLAAAEKRYYRVIRRDTHEHWFKPEAFDNVHNVVGRGQGNLNLAMGGIPELYLCERPREAAEEEQRQMSEFSSRRLQDDAKLSEIKERMGNVVGTEILGGVSMGRSSWGQDTRTK